MVYNCNEVRQDINEDRLDPQFVPLSVLQQQLDRNKWNDNVPLIALVTGRILTDRNGAIARLATQAFKMWEEGTGQLSEKERRALIAGAKKAKSSVRKLVARTNSATIGKRSFLLLELDWIFLSLHKMHGRASERWYFGPWVLNKLTDEYSIRLTKLTEEILQTRDTPQYGHLLCAFADSIIQCVSVTVED